MTLDNEGIVKLLEQYETESKAIKKETFKVMWYMRGSISIDEAFALGMQDKEIMNEVIEENLETTKESGLPFF